MYIANKKYSRGHGYVDAKGKRERKGITRETERDKERDTNEVCKRVT